MEREVDLGRVVKLEEMDSLDHVVREDLLDQLVQVVRWVHLDQVETEADQASKAELDHQAHQVVLELGDELEPLAIQDLLENQVEQDGLGRLDELGSEVGLEDEETLVHEENVVIQEPQH